MSPRYTWRTFVFFFVVGTVVKVLLEAFLSRWLSPEAAMGAGAGALVVIVFSGNRRWREPKVFATAVAMIASMALFGALAVPLVL